MGKMDSLLMPLTQIVMHTNRPDIQTADALLAKMLGDQVGGRMLARLLYWFPKSVKVGGWVYKSWRDWNAECALSPAQIKRIHHTQLLEQFGISRKLMKANGAPTTHYLINLDIFLNRIATFLGLTLEQVRTFFASRDGRSAGLNGKADKTPYTPEPDTSGIPFSWEDSNHPTSPVSDMPDTSPIINGISAKHWWYACKQQLELQLDTATYTRFFRQAEFSGYEPKNHRWTIQVPNEPVRQYLQERCYRDVRQMLVNIIGQVGDLIFEVKPLRS
jgi:hypothetical protein